MAGGGIAVGVAAGAAAARSSLSACARTRPHVSVTAGEVVVRGGDGGLAAWRRFSSARWACAFIRSKVAWSKSYCSAPPSSTRSTNPAVCQILTSVLVMMPASILRLPSTDGMRLASKAARCSELTRTHAIPRKQAAVLSTKVSAATPLWWWLMSSMKRTLLVLPMTRLGLLICRQGRVYSILRSRRRASNSLSFAARLSAQYWVCFQGSGAWPCETLSFQCFPLLSDFVDFSMFVSTLLRSLLLAEEQFWSASTFDGLLETALIV
mmetsp:Transcript_53259/g.111096  ORF Transcript_53259/g.111096 Transcript_53259/m.111096 type:complete len:266 (-) Transcript_53259:119-916(-)